MKMKNNMMTKERGKRNKHRKNERQSKSRTTDQEQRTKREVNKTCFLPSLTKNNIPFKSTPELLSIHCVGVCIKVL